MDDSERDEVLGKIDQLRKEIEQRNTTKDESKVKDAPSASDFGKYMELGSFYANIPHDPYSHQFQLIHKPGRAVKDLSEILDPNILLSNISDSKTMYFYQRDFYYLSRFFDMGKRSVGVMNVWKALFHPWVGQIRMTSAMKGRERDLQSFLDVPAMPSEGYGVGWWEKRKQKKKKKELMDHLQPENSYGGNIYG
jgi:hypothetical protein